MNAKMDAQKYALTEIWIFPEIRVCLSAKAR